MSGWFVNVATIFRPDEALLASGFIVTVHLFKTRFRPDRFPMAPDRSHVCCGFLDRLPAMG